MNFDACKGLILKSEARAFGKGATEAEIQEAEKQLGWQIRGDYRQFLREFGWGGIGSFELFGLGSDVPSFLNLVEITRSERIEMLPRLKPELLPIMNDGGGNLYCLDMDSNGPRIVLWDHEGGEEQVFDVVAEDFISWFMTLVQGEK